MISEPRTIARVFELFHIPLQYDIEELRGVYLEVSSACGYDNFIRESGGARLESAATEDGVISRVSFMRDRVCFLEERSNASLENFRRRVEVVVRVAAEQLRIPVFVARNITVRAIVTAPGRLKAADFIASHLCRVAPHCLDTLDRPVSIVGVRLQLPAQGSQGGGHQVRIESYRGDPFSVLVEDEAGFKAPVQSRDHAQLKEELREVDRIALERVPALLGQLIR